MLPIGHSGNSWFLKSKLSRQDEFQHAKGSQIRIHYLILVFYTVCTYVLPDICKYYTCYILYAKMKLTNHFAFTVLKMTDATF